MDEDTYELNTQITHEHLLQIMKKLPEDYTPYGTIDRDDEGLPGAGDDCSCGCRFFANLGGHLWSDWGVCTNPQSHRCGLLTFEHQGCLHFEPQEK